MGLISRTHTGAYADGETLEAADLEGDIQTVYTLVNGNIETTNIKSGAGITGSQIASTTIAAANIAGATITTTQMAASAVPKHYVDSDNTSDAATTSATFVNVPSIVAASLTPGSVNDIIYMSFTASMQRTSGESIYHFGFAVDGVDTGAVGFYRLGEDHQTSTYTWAVSPTAGQVGAAVTVMPRYLQFSSGAVSPVFYASSINKVFTAMILPGK